MNIPKSHPRYHSLKTRELVENGVTSGITSLAGLVAQGRGEAFDYLIGEQTHNFAKNAIEAAAALLLLANHPVISVNGNTAALSAKELATLSCILPAKLEVNLFHTSQDREKKIAEHLRQHGAKEVLLPGKSTILTLESNRRWINPEGQAKADVVFLAIEDSDHIDGLITMGKKVITIDLNPLSRSAKKATITIVDNVIRALPLLNERIKQFKENESAELENLVSHYNNQEVLQQAEKQIRSGTLL